MKKSISLLGLVGALVWAAAVLLRMRSTPYSGAAGFLIGIAPNIGVVWLGVSLYVQFFPYLFRHAPTRAQRLYALPAMLLILVLSEIVHAAFLGAGFDWYDLLASLVAALLMLPAVLPESAA